MVRPSFRLSTCSSLMGASLSFDTSAAELACSKERLAVKGRTECQSMGPLKLCPNMCAQGQDVEVWL